MGVRGPCRQPPVGPIANYGRNRYLRSQTRRCKSFVPVHASDLANPNLIQSFPDERTYTFGSKAGYRHHSHTEHGWSASSQ